MEPEDIHSVQIDGKASCVCGHHPLEHDMQNNILTGGPARCEHEGCTCANLDMAPGSPGPFVLLDADGRRVKP